MIWSKNCGINDEARRDSDLNANPPVFEIRARTGATFKKTDPKLYVPVVTLSIEDDNKLLEQLKSGIKRTIKLNKYRSEMSNQTKTKNLNYLIDSTFHEVNRLFVLSFKNEDEEIKTDFLFQNILCQM